MDFVLQQPFPYKSMNFMHRYMQMYYNLNQQQKWRLFLPLYIILAVNMGHYLFLAIFEPSTTTQKLLTGDIIRLVNLPPITNLVVVGSLFISGYYFHLNFFETTHITADFLAELLNFKGNRSHFLISPYRPNGKLVSKYISQYCYFVLNALQIFIFAIDFFIFMSQYYGVRAVLRLSLSMSSWVNFVVILAIAELNIISFYLALYVFSFSFMLLGTVAFTLLEALRLLMKQLERLLPESKNNKWKSSFSLEFRNALAHFRHQYTRVVILLSLANRYVARAFMPLIAVNCPSNALLTITLLTSPSGRLDLVTQMLVVMVLLEQFICIFLIHSLLAMLNERLKVIAKKYTPLMYADKEIGNNRKEKLLSNLFLSKFHTSKPYGFTYHKFGRISSFNFVKYILLYSELLMFVYKTGFYD